MVRVQIDHERWAAWALAQPTPVVLLLGDVVHDCNPAACRLFALAEDELVSAAINDLLIVDADDAHGADEPARPVRVLSGMQWVPRTMTEVRAGDSVVLSFSEPPETPMPPGSPSASTAGRFVLDANETLAGRAGSGTELAEQILDDASERIGCSLLWSSVDGANLLRRTAAVGFDRIGVDPDAYAHRILAAEQQAYASRVAVEIDGTVVGAGRCLAVPVMRAGAPVGALAAVQPTGAPPIRLDHAAVVHAAADQLGVFDALIRAESVHDELAHAAEDMRLFASALAHDLRAPIRHIAAFGEIVLDEVRADADDEVIANVERILAAAMRATEQLNDLVDYVRGADVALVTDDVAAIVTPALDRIRSVADDVGATIEVDRLGGQVRSDPAVAGAILDNLLENAIKYRDPDRPLSIRVHAASTPRFRVIHVTDNGLGLPEGREEMAFAAFRRLHPGVPEQGSGMGLALSRRMAGLLHGELSARRLPEGTRFSLALPRAD